MDLPRILLVIQFALLSTVPSSDPGFSSVVAGSVVPKPK